MLRLFRVYISTRVAALLASEFILIYACYLAATFFWLRADPSAFLGDENGWWRILIVVCSLVLASYFLDLYSNLRFSRELLQKVVLVVATAFLTEAILSYLKLPQWVVPARPMILGSALTFTALVASRFIFVLLLRKMPTEGIVFLGNSRVVQQIASHLDAHPEKGLTPLGFLDDSNSTSANRLGAISDLLAVVDRLHPKRIVVGMQERRAILPVFE